MSNYKVTADSLNMRSEPSLNGDRIAILRKNQVIPSGEVRTDREEPGTRQWMKVEIPSFPVGWASMKFLAPTEEPVDKNEYLVIAAALNVRSKPSIEGEVIGFLRKGEKIGAGQKSSDGRWMEINHNGLSGWSSLKYLVPDIGPDDGPPWLRVALAEQGVREYSGAADNPRIVEYHRSTTLGPRLSNQDETPWCSSFVNWCIERSGYEGTDSAWARSWLNWGKKLTTPRKGCVAVFKRGTNSGHVGFYIGETASNIRLLGGNQSDAVNVTNIDKSRLLGYRWLE
jgi:uncharacterized protein (TIGR02594 family)